MKGVDARGFAFFTNYESRKGRELRGEPARGALLPLARPLGEQVRVGGRVSRVTAADVDSDAYFATRPRESQIGAWASPQSAPLASRGALEDAARAIAARFAGADVPRPPFWGGYLLRPERIEFWESAAGRLHHRTLFERAGDGWTVSLLNP